MEAKMKSILSGSKYLLLITAILCGTAYAPAQEQSTEIQGFYQTYKDFSFKVGEGYELLDIPNTRLGGGGFTIAQNLASWFAVFSQTTFYGSVEGTYLKARVINNLEGLRWQTKRHGPLQAYVKAGLGFSHISLDYVSGEDIGGEIKFSYSLGGGAFIWMSDNFGLVFDASHTAMGMPNLADLPGRDKWDSGLTLTTGLAIRF
jgi:hypothetical protein